MSMQNAAILARYLFAPAFAIPKRPTKRVKLALSRIVRAFATYYRNWRNIGQLKGLSAATLRDIGIDRAEIMSLVHEKAHGSQERRHALD